MTMYITAVSPPDAGQHHAITSVRWLKSDDSTSKVSTKAVMIEWMLRTGTQVWVAAEDGPVRIKVVQGNPPYLRTYRDDTPTDNLLALPRF